MSHYYQANQAQDALAVVAKWMSNDKNLKVNYHSGTAVDADIFGGVIRIPRLATASGLTDETLTTLRGRVYHEAGHIFDKNILKKIKDEGRYPSGVLFEIWNAVEDMRMERAVATRFLGALPIFTWNNNYHNVKIAESVANGKEHGAIWESLVAMMFQSSGNAPKWRLSDKAQKYFDSAYDVFTKWKSTKNSFDTLDLAEEIFEILKETHEEDKKEQDENNQKESDEQEQDDQEQEEQEDDGGQGDGENDDSDTDEEEDNSQGGSGDFDDEDDQDENNQKDSDDSDEESDEEENPGKGDSSDEDDDENNQKDSDSQDSDSDSSDEYDDIDEGEESSSTSGDFDKVELSDEELEEIEAQLIKELEEEIEGLSLEELQDADIDKALNEVDRLDADYLSDKSRDIHKEIKPQDYHSEDYKETRASVSAAVAAMTSALQQALRARTRCRKNGYQRRGKIDNRRLVHIAKGLSKDVFYNVKQGEKLDTAVEIIIDESLSMSQGGQVEPVRQVALAMAEVLTQLNIPFEITGTSTEGSSLNNGLDRTRSMLYKHYKTFGQSWATVKHAIMQTSAIDNNVDGEAIEYCAHRLQQRPEARKIVLSLSDGEPYNGETERGKLYNHLIRTCEKSRENGVEVYGFGVGTQSPKEFYGEDYFIYLPKRTLDTSFAKAFVDIVSGGQLFV